MARREAAHSRPGPHTGYGRSRRVPTPASRARFNPWGWSRGSGLAGRVVDETGRADATSFGRGGRKPARAVAAGPAGGQLIGEIVRPERNLHRGGERKIAVAPAPVARRPVTREM